MNDLTSPDLLMIWGFLAAYLLVIAAILWPRYGTQTKCGLWLVPLAILAWPLTAAVLVITFLIDLIGFLIRFMRAPH